MLRMYNSYSVELAKNYWHILTIAIFCVCCCMYFKRFICKGKDNTNFQQNHSRVFSDEAEKNIDITEETDYGYNAALGEDILHNPYQPIEYPDNVMVEKSTDFLYLLRQRRTVRFFRSDPVPDEVIKNIIEIAGTSPSGAHTEPWTFVVIKDQDVKQAIREIVEDEERINYDRRMSRQWTADLRPLKTTWSKPYLTDAPVLLLLFRQVHSQKVDGQIKNHYYSEISVAMAAGLLIAAIQVSGLTTLTSTPLNCGPRLRVLLSRPANEKLMLLFPVGKAAYNCTVPDIKRKSFEDLCYKF